MPNKAPTADTPTQKRVIKDVLHDFKDGDLKTSAGEKVTNRKQAVAIALSEAGASNEVSPAQNRHNLNHTLTKKRSTSRPH